MITTKVTLKIDMDSNRTFSALVTTDGNAHTQKVGGVNASALLKKVVMLLNATLEDMADED